MIMKKHLAKLATLLIKKLRNNASNLKELHICSSIGYIILLSACNVFTHL